MSKFSVSSHQNFAKHISSKQIVRVRALRARAKYCAFFMSKTFGRCIMNTRNEINSKIRDLLAAYLAMAASLPDISKEKNPFTQFYGQLLHQVHIENSFLKCACLRFELLIIIHILYAHNSRLSIRVICSRTW